MSKRPKIDVFRKLCNAKGGIVSGIASSIGVTRKQVYEWCDKWTEYNDALLDARETFIDLAETRLQSLVQGVPFIEKDEQGIERFAGWKTPPSENSIIFALRTLGKKRGYSERQEIDLNNNLKGSISVEDWIKMRDGK